VASVAHSKATNVLRICASLVCGDHGLAVTARVSPKPMRRVLIERW
jgi:hypothetical protein